jgi:hypothetical protein
MTDFLLLAEIIELRQSMSRRRLAKHLGITMSKLGRILKKHHIAALPETIRRNIKTAAQSNCGKTPWNKGKQLSAETKLRIGESLTGPRNGQYRRGMTEDEKIRWRETYRRPGGGADKMRAWIASGPGQSLLARQRRTTKSPEWRAAASKRSHELIASGRLRPSVNSKQGWYKSIKAGDVYFRSSYELAYFKKLDASGEVVTYVSEPFLISYIYKGVRLKYVPDVLVTMTDGTTILVEVKPKKMMLLPKNIAKATAARRYCKRHLLQYITITEDDLDIKT